MNANCSFLIVSCSLGFKVCICLYFRIFVHKFNKGTRNTEFDVDVESVVKVSQKFIPGLRIRVTLIRIWIWIQLFTLMRIRMLLIKVTGICDHWSRDPPGLYFKPPGLHCERPWPSTALFWASKAVLLIQNQIRIYENPKLLVGSESGSETEINLSDLDPDSNTDLR